MDDTKDFTKVAYYLDMGLGKTFVGSEKMVELASELNLLICQKSKVDDWVEHFIQYYPDYSIYNLTDKKQFQWFFEGKGIHPKKVAIINYDLVFRRKYLLTLTDFTLILDESSMIQNDKAKRSKSIMKMQFKNVILLSGTPTSGKYENLWTQIRLLGWNISKELYNKQYVNWKKIDLGGFVQWIVDKGDPYKNVDRLKSKLRHHGAVFLKTEDCFELPEQTIIPVTVKTTKEYRKFWKDGVVTVTGTKMVEDSAESDFFGTAYKLEDVELVGDTVLTKRLYARQLCGHYNQEKLQAFSDLVSSTQDRLIVFYNFTAELDALKKIVKALDRPISEVNGQTKNLSKYENESNSVTLIQYQAGSKGLNLQKANKIIYFTPTEKCEDWMQSQKRIHRIGQTNTCFYYLMICKNSIEEDILQTLKMRKDYTNELFREYNLR